MINPPTPHHDVSHYLTDFFAEHLPITEYLNMHVRCFQADQFSLAIDLQPSINDKLTAFGGSLYCLCVMNCWGMVYLQGRSRGINPDLVVRHAEINYQAPVDDELIVATCASPTKVDWDQFYSDGQGVVKRRVTLESEIRCGGRVAVSFKGQYAVVGLKV